MQVFDSWGWSWVSGDGAGLSQVTKTGCSSPWYCDSHGKEAVAIAVCSAGDVLEVHLELVAAEDHHMLLSFFSLCSQQIITCYFLCVLLLLPQCSFQRIWCWCWPIMHIVFYTHTDASYWEDDGLRMTKIVIQNVKYIRTQATSIYLYTSAMIALSHSQWYFMHGKLAILHLS